MSTAQASTTHATLSAPGTEGAHLSTAPPMSGERDRQPDARRATMITHEHAMSTRATVRRLIALIAVLGAALAIGAFTLSFDALSELATISGLNPTLAWLWPLIVDGFILIATAAAVALRDRGRRVTWYPWATLILFSTISVAGNGLHASNHADHTAVSVAIAAGVSAVPALALLLASHLMVVLLGTPNRTMRDHHDTDKAAERTETSVRNAAPRPAATPRPAAAATAASQTSVTLPPTSTRTVKPSSSKIDTELRAWVHAEHAAGRTVTGADIAAKFDVSPATGRRRLAALRNAQSAEPSND